MRRRLAVRMLSAVAVLVTGQATAPQRAQAAAETARFVPLAAPTRLIDTRTGLGTPRTPLVANSSVDLQITGAVVPGNATAALINITAVNTASDGWLQVLPTGRGTVGSSSTINLDRKGVTLPNASFAPLGNGGSLTVYSTFTTDVIVDVFGYFEPAISSASGRLISLKPTRILDTRTRLGWSPSSPGDAKDCSSFPTRAAAQDWFDAYYDLFGDVARLDNDGDRIVCEPDELPANPAPVTPPPTGAPPNPGDTKNCTDFATYAEAKAWFDKYFPYYGDVAKLDNNNDGRPCETLPGAPRANTVGRPLARVLGGTTITVHAAGAGGVPLAGVSAVVLNVTAVEPRSEGWVQVAPTPVSIGASSNLNTTPGVTSANLVVVPMSASGNIDLHSTVGGDLLADVFGYFTDSSANDVSVGLFVPITPTRALDTRKDSQNRGVGAGVTVGLNLQTVLPPASAFAANLTSTNSKADGYLEVAPHPLTIGTHSNLNTSYDGQTVANAVVSPISPSGPIVQIYTLYNADILLDITGYFTSALA